jgi:teichuronic acid biosynthesis glycosyltransferase TuaC
MHLCIVSPGYPTSRTIDFIFVDQLCKAISSKGHKVTIIAPQSLLKSILRGVPISKRKSSLTFSNESEITLFRPFYFSFGNIKIMKRFNFECFNGSVESVLRKFKEKPDVCYGHFWTAVYSIYPFAKRNNIPLIASSGEEAITFHREYVIDDLQDFLAYVKGIIAVSTKNKIENIEAGIASEDKCEVILNAVNDSLFYKRCKSSSRNRLGYSDKDFIVAFVGQFSERKGVKILSNALTFLNDENIKALFIGNGSEMPDYKGTLFIGSLSHDLLPDYLNCADVFVLPSINEGCSNAIIEAMACGLPIISSDMLFNHDLLNKRNAILVNPRDINAIANAIRLLKEDATYRNELSHNAILTVQELTLEKRADKILDYIKRKIDKKQ